MGCGHSFCFDCSVFALFARDSINTRGSTNKTTPYSTVKTLEASAISRYLIGIVLGKLIVRIIINVTTNMAQADPESDLDLGNVSSEPPAEPAPEEIPDQKETPPTQIEHASAFVQEYTDKALEFASTASNETLGAWLIGLCAATYYVLGRLGLVLIGLLCGVALHASWEGGTGGSADDDSIVKEARRRREVGLDVVARVLDWRDNKSRTKSGADTEIHEAVVKPAERLDYSKFAPATASALTELTDAVIRDYVKYANFKCPV